MKMAKASEADMNMALNLCSALEAVDRRSFPHGQEGEFDAEDFDVNDDAHCGQVLRYLCQVLQSGSIGRVIWGMYVLLDPANKLVDPEAHTLEPHPDAVVNEKDAARLRWLLEDHDTDTRERCRAVLERMPTMSYAAGTAAIDAAMLESAAVGAV